MIQRRCAVIGSPISHSRSPIAHRAAYDWLGLPWTYDRYDVGADDVVRFVAGLGTDWRGLSVTMPCKRAILPLGEPDEVVRALGVANTVIFDGPPGDVTTTRIRNTDVTGIQMVLTDVDLTQGVVVLGNGATARSIVYALAQMGVEQVGMIARDEAKTEEVRADGEQWGIEITPPGPSALIMSTVPAHAALAWLESPKLGLAEPETVFDVLYDPWPTPLACFASDRGARVLTGLDLLAAQAVGQVEFMTGHTVPVEIVRQALQYTGGRAELCDGR